MEKSDWFLRFVPRPEARVRLFCFHHAGGSAGFYASWAGALPPEIELIAVQLPGRGRRIKEPNFVTLAPLVGELMSRRPWFEAKPFAFFGHSMGALVAFELARALERHAVIGTRLFASGCSAPRIFHETLARGRASLPERLLIDELRHRGGTPEELFQHRELMELALPAIRADYHLLEQYEYQPSMPLVTPLTVLGGLEDPDVPVRHLEFWREEARDPASFRVHVFPGGHFYLQEEREAVLGLVAASLLGREELMRQAGVTRP